MEEVEKTAEFREDRRIEFDKIKRQAWGSERAKSSQRDKSDFG